MSKQVDIEEKIPKDVASTKQEKKDAVDTIQTSIEN
jgi:hypothetical protein